MDNVGVSSIVKLKLSRAELYVIMRLLKTTSMPGIDLSWFQNPPADLSPGILVQTVDTAVKALVSRGYLVPLQADTASSQSLRVNSSSNQYNWKKVGIPEGIVALLSICASPMQSLALTWRTSQGVRLLWLHACEQLVVAVTSPLAEIYQFTVLPDWDASRSVLIEALGLAEQQAPVQPLVIKKLSADSLAQARLAIERSDPIEALSRLTSEGISESTAQSFLEAVSDCTAIANLTITSLEKGQKQVNLVIIVTPTICLMLQQLYPDQTCYAVQAVSAATIRAWLTATWTLQR